jgi:RNA polymerase sigma factor (sigma-70 family)
VAVTERAVGRSQREEEDELIAAVRRGDDRAFGVLYERYRPRIGAFVARMVADHGRAEDIAQEVFIAALRRLRATDRPVMFKPWLYEIAKNACIDEHRRTRRACEVPLDGDDDVDGASRMLALSPPPEVAIESKQRLDDLRGAFRGLSESHHRILVLRELEGLSYTQIGDRLGISKPVVESTLFRARRRLGEEFEELESGRRCARVQSMISAAKQEVARLGARERQLVSRHLAHCDTCRRQARVTGVAGLLLEGDDRTKRAPVAWLRPRKSRGTAPSSA